MIKIGKMIKKKIFNLKLNISIRDTNNINPIIAFKVFDLSPVINNEEKNINIVRKNIIVPYFFSFITFNMYPKIINIKPLIKAPATGSSLKKLTILTPKGCGTPFIEVATQPKILAPVNLSKYTSKIKIKNIIVQKKIFLYLI